MRAHVIVLLALPGVACAQNWALLNPAYKYNYSNDGSDTISNQIRVTHIDTLGLDSFRYELNRIARPCSGCGADCDLQIRIPQFLMGECHIGHGSVEFGDTVDLVVQPEAALGMQWVFNVQDSIIGTVVEVSEELLFGAMDSVKTMTTTLNDTVRWTKSFGILYWHLHDAQSYDLIGLHGPEMGQLIPSLAEFFPFQPGDDVQFYSRSDYSMVTYTTYTRFRIEDRIEAPDQLIFSGFAYQKAFGDGGGDLGTTYEPMEWVVDSVHIPVLRVLRSAPQELVNLGDISPFPSLGALEMVARHHIDSVGSYAIVAQAIATRPLFQSVDTFQIDCVPIVGEGWYQNSLYFDDRLGLRELAVSSGYNFQGFQTFGAVLSGDTIGTVLGDEFYDVVGMSDADLDHSPLHPNPACDRIFLSPTALNKRCSIFDIQGRLMLSHIPTSVNEQLGLQEIPMGSYVLRIEGMAPQRFVIAR